MGSVKLIDSIVPLERPYGRLMQLVREPDFAIGGHGGFATSAGIRILREPERGM